MTRTALARTYRPRRFSEVAMQEHVSATLRAAVARDRVAHAYLFCGPRGVGKTTAARVLAMALNCPNRVTDGGGADAAATEASEAGEPCGDCESCQRIWSGRTSLDVVEIDAASNRGVDDARELRERAMYAPTDDRRYKVYIIDEAHMLTREAWNALLKILEEPPPRVIFVFATTEPQKIQQAAPPILSRCQRFDFRRISVPEIVARLEQIVAAESIEADQEALLPLARRAEGGMRDAISLLDQVLSFADGRLSAEDVRQVLGLVGEEAYLELFEIIAERRHADVFRFVGRLLDQGYDLGEFYRGLADALRTLLIVKLDGVENAEGVRQDLEEAYRERVESFSTGDLLRMLAQVSELDTEGRFRKSANPRIALEALLLRFAHLDRTVRVEELLEAASSGSAPASAGGAGPPSAPSGKADVGSSRGRDPAPARAAADDPATDADAVLQSLQRDPEGLPPGLSVFLRAARVSGDANDTVRLELPAGPGLERLTSDVAARRALESAFARRLGRSVTLEVAPRGAEGEGDDAPPAPRLNPQQVKRDRLERLASEEPALRRAVQEWDLELLD